MASIDDESTKNEAISSHDEGEKCSCPHCAELHKMFEKLLEEKKELDDRYMRKHADFENYRKRVTKEKQDAIQYANTQLMKPLLDVLDNLERARNAGNEANANLENLQQGVDLTLQTLRSTLSQHGLSKIDTLGAEFDPLCHQAITRVEDASVTKAVVVEEYQAGYSLFDRILRPSMVRVAVPVSEVQQEQSYASESSKVSEST